MAYVRCALDASEDASLKTKWHFSIFHVVPKKHIGCIKKFPNKISNKIKLRIRKLVFKIKRQKKNQNRRSKVR